MADNTPVKQTANSLVQSFPSIFPSDVGRWYPKHIMEGLHTSGEQNVQAFSVSASLESEVFSYAKDPSKLVLILKSVGMRFSSDPMMRDQEDKKWLIKLRSGISFEPVITADEQRTISMGQGVPKTQNNVTKVSETMTLNVNSSITASDGGASGTVGSSQDVTRNINYELHDFSNVDTSQGNRASWEWYLSRVGKDTAVRNTKDKLELVSDLLDKGYASVTARELPNLAKEGTMDVQVIGQWYLDRAHWVGKKQIQFKVTARSWPLSLNLPYAATTILGTITDPFGIKSVVGDGSETYIFLDEKTVEAVPVIVDLSSLA